MDKNIDQLLSGLAKTKFRGSFHLNEKMKNYVKEKGIAKIESDTYEIIKKRIAIANPKNDGKQTPMKQVHPVFIAQHATGTCCRKCIDKIHHIAKDKELTSDEIKYLTEIIENWILREIK